VALLEKQWIVVGFLGRLRVAGRQRAEGREQEKL
jgi:hypothetical protein